MGNEVIRSRQNRLVKLVCSLDRKKSREEEGLFRFDGIKLCLEAISKGIEPEYIVVSESRESEMRDRLGSERELVIVSDEVFSKMSDERSPEGVITVARTLSGLHRIVNIPDDEVPSKCERVFLLESIRDPGNLGTIIRTAASLGIDRVAVSSDCADIYNPKTIRGAMGALFMLKIDVIADGQTEKYISALRASGRRVFAAALDPLAVDIRTQKVLPTDVFVIGNEGHGICMI